MAYQKKYSKGRLIDSLDDLDYELRTTQFIYINDKITHAGWVYSMMFTTILLFYRRLSLFRAVKNDIPIHIPIKRKNKLQKHFSEIRKGKGKR